MDVLPLVLSEEEAMLLPEEVLIKLSELATDRVVAMLLKYLKDSKNEEVKAKIKRTFQRPLTVRRDSKSSSIAMQVKNLCDVTYRDIYYGVPELELVNLRDSINSILNNPYAVAWIEPITAKQYRECIKELNTMSWQEKDVQIAIAIQHLADKVEKMGYAFKDPPQMKPRPTEVTRILNRTMNYRLIVRGIDFLLKQMNENREPSTWRFL